VESGRTVGNVIGALPGIVGAIDGRDLGAGVGDGSVSGGAVVRGKVGGGVEGTKDNGSLSVGRGDGVSNVSGAAVCSGFTVAFGDGFAVAVEVGFGLGLGVGMGLGVSSEGAGVFAWNGVDAASCARTNVAVTSNAMAKTNERMLGFSVKIVGRR